MLVLGVVNTGYGSLEPWAPCAADPSWAAARGDGHVVRPPLPRDGGALGRRLVVLVLGIGHVLWVAHQSIAPGSRALPGFKEKGPMSFYGSGRSRGVSSAPV